MNARAAVSPGEGPTGASSAAAVPYSLERPGGPMPDMVARPAGSLSSAASVTAAGPPGPAGDDGTLPSGPPGSAPNVAGPAARGLEPVGLPPMTAADPPPMAGPAPAPTDSAVSPSAAPNGRKNGAGATKPAPSGDPLLGPNPDLMPELPPLPDMKPAATPAAAATPAKGKAPATATSAAPASPSDDLPSLAPVAAPAESPAAPAPTGGADAPAPAGPIEAPPAAAPSSPPELGPPSADNRTGGSGQAAGAVQVADLPPLEPVPSTGPAADGVVQRTAASDSSTRTVRRATARRDGRILRTSLQKPTDDAREQPIPATWHQASLTAAQVGDEIITLRELVSAVREQCVRRQTRLENLSVEERNMAGSLVLKRMIDQSLLLQEAKRTIKNSKMYDQFTQEADRFWRDEHLPQLEHEHQADNEQQLRDRLKENGRSLDSISLMTRQNWMAENFLHAKIKDRIKVDLPELLKYYDAHKNDKEFDRPAQIIWREIVVETGRYPRPEDARRKIEALHQALRRGADFAGLAKAQSEGPTRSREQGGLMQTSPRTYGVASVNEALESLPAGQISGILEGPTSFHIVRVDERRAAGPAPFFELQDQIRSTLLEKKYQSERTAYIGKLWEQTLVSTIFDDTESDPRRFTN